MKNKRLNKYLSARKKSRTASSSEQIKTDNKTDQDFPGYPHGTATEEIITPDNEAENKIAGVHTKDGEKMLDTPARKKKIREEQSDGSANAFEGTEMIKDEED